MPGASLQLRVIDRQQVVYHQDFTGPIELGRQSDAAEELYSCKLLGGGRLRAVIARLDEDTLSRRHALLEPLDGSKVRLTNVSAKVPIRLSDGSDLAAGVSRDLPLPASLVIGRKTVRVQIKDKSEPSGVSLRGLPVSMAPPGQLSMMAPRPAATLVSSSQIDMKEMLGWLQASMDVLHSAATSSDFFEKAAQAVVDIVGCDAGRILLLQGEEWKPVVVRTAPRVRIDPRWNPSQMVLASVCEEKRTIWQGPESESAVAESLIGVEMVVAAPILNREGEVIGAVYGDCHQSVQLNARPRITELEAVLVELLAKGVATGLARQEQEKVALEANVRFEQFFTKELSRELVHNPAMLQGRDCDVTLLFCDIRGFSRISERLGPARTVEWVSNVMDALSDCVLAHQGVLVDYIGDELMAMWGAPMEQPDHARLACRAALDMFNLLPSLNERWEPVIGEPLGLGIGVNTGKARVGNTGSRHKFKYGPLGHTVNLASRVQGATKYLRTRLLVTEFTQAHLDADFEARRLCKVRVVNIAGAVNLFELAPASTVTWADAKLRYEKALVEFEQGNIAVATQLLNNLLADYPNDGPALVLLARAIGHQIKPDAGEFDPVWDLPGK